MHHFRKEYLKNGNTSNTRIWIHVFCTVSRYLSMFWCLWDELFDVQAENTPNILCLSSYSVVDNFSLFSLFFISLSLHFSVSLSLLQYYVLQTNCALIQLEWSWAQATQIAIQIFKCVLGPLQWKRVTISAFTLNSSRPKKNLIYLRCLMVTKGYLTLNAS